MNLKPFCTVETHKKELHFLPVFYRICYKIALLTFKCLYDKAPLYILAKSCDFKENQPHI